MRYECDCINEVLSWRANFVRLPVARITLLVGRRTRNPKVAGLDPAPRRTFFTSFQCAMVSQCLVCYFLIVSLPRVCLFNLLCTACR